MRSLSFPIILIVAFAITIDNAFAQQPGGALDPERDAWRYVVDDEAAQAARAAEKAADALMATFPGHYQAKLKKEFEFSERVNLALDLAHDHFHMIRRAGQTNEGQFNELLDSYGKLVEYAKLTLDGVVEGKENQRLVRQTGKLLEVKLRAHMESLEELSRALGEPKVSALTGLLERLRVQRLELLNRVFGGTIFTAPQSNTR